MIYLFDEIIIPDLGDIHYKRLIVERNKWIVDNSDVIMCYVNKDYGGAYATMKYAKSIGKKIIICR